MKLGRSCILSIGPFVFAPTMACSVAVVYFTMAEWLLQCGVSKILLESILDAPVLIKRISHSDGGECMVKFPTFVGRRHVVRISGGAYVCCVVWRLLWPILRLFRVCFKLNDCLQ